jgi:hypothetical protein
MKTYFDHRSKEILPHRNNRLLDRFVWAGTRRFALNAGRAGGRNSPLRILAIRNN